MNLTHKIQLCSNSKINTFFMKACGVARYTWNWALAECEKQYKETGKLPNLMQLKKRWNKEKPEWVYESPKDANQQPFSYLSDAYSRFYKKLGRLPRFKKKGVKDSFYISCDTVSFNANHIRIPKLGWIKMTESLRFTGKVLSVTIKRDVDRWFACVSVDTDAEVKQAADACLGVDIGIKDAVSVSDVAGTIQYKRSLPKSLKTQDKKLKHFQRALVRKKKGSKRRERAKLKVAKSYRKIRRIRNDFTHKITTEIVSKAKTVVIEDLNVKGMLKNHNLARAVSNVGFYEIRRQLTYKCQNRGVALVVADRYYPSSKLCHCCGHKLDKLSLSTRTWSCPKCGNTQDRDYNAAMNLSSLGFRDETLAEHYINASRLSKADAMKRVLNQ